MTELGSILKLMTTFGEGKLDAPAFTKRYIKLWNKLVDEQNAAIARHPLISQKLNELQEMHRNGEISSERYSEAVQEQYALLPNTTVRPGSKVSEILDHIFVEVDSYRENEDEAISPYITADELHEAVTQALNDLAT